jgi:predicted Zn-dependent protease
MALPFSRSQEQEADHRGLYYAAMAGYDPRGAVSFWKKMQGGKKRKMPQFLSTHPDPGNRIDFLNANMDNALALYRDAKVARGEKPNP